MQLEVGKYYRTRDGRKVGPMLRYGRVVEGYVAFHTGPDSGALWRESDGLSYPEENKSNDPDQDIIAEWTDEPPQPTQPTLSGHTIDHIAMDSLRHHYATEMEPLQKEAFRIVLRYYGVSV